MYLTPESFILAKEIDAGPCRRFDQDGLDYLSDIMVLGETYCHNSTGGPEAG